MRRQASVVAARGSLERRLSSCGTWAWLLHSMWNLPGSGIELLSPALAGGFLATDTPGNPYIFFLKLFFFFGVISPLRRLFRYFPPKPIS